MADYHGGSLPPKPGPRTLGSRYILKNKTKCDWWTDDANAIYIWPLTITDFEIIAIFFFLKFPKTISNVIWVSSNGSYRGIFAEIEMCLRGKQFFFNNKEQNQMLWRSFKTKTKNKHKNKKHQKKNFFALSPSKLSLFFRNLFQKNKNITSKNP